MTTSLPLIDSLNLAVGLISTSLSVYVGYVYQCWLMNRTTSQSHSAAANVTSMVKSRRALALMIAPMGPKPPLIR